MWRRPRSSSGVTALRRAGRTSTFRRKGSLSSDDEEWDEKTDSRGPRAAPSHPDDGDGGAPEGRVVGLQRDDDGDDDDDSDAAAAPTAKKNSPPAPSAGGGGGGGGTGDDSGEASPKRSSRSSKSLSRLKEALAGDELEKRYRVMGTSQSSRATSSKKEETATEGLRKDKGSSLSTVLSGMKKLQRGRGRRNGLEMSFRQSESTKEKSDSENEGNETEGYGLLTRNFTKNLDSSITLDQHLEEFLSASSLANKKDDESTAERPERVSPSVGLYSVPKHLEVADSTKELKEKMTWVTGLTEVALPMEVRLKNIEATERAKRRMMRTTATEPDAEKQSGDAIRSIAFGTRFFKFEPARLANSSKRATDDALFGKFRKRQKFAFKK